MRDIISKIIDELTLSCEELVKVPCERLKSMQQLANDILSDFTDVGSALKSFNLLCNFGRTIFYNAMLEVNNNGGDKK